MGEAKNSFICLVQVVSEFIILRSCRRATYRTSVDREIPCSLPGSSATTEKPAPSSLGRPLLGEDRPLLPDLLLRLGGILRRDAGDFPLWFHRRCCTQFGRKLLHPAAEPVYGIPPPAGRDEVAHHVRRRRSGDLRSLL